MEQLSKGIPDPDTMVSLRQLEKMEYLVSQTILTRSSINVLMHLFAACVREGGSPTRDARTRPSSQSGSREWTAAHH